MTWLLVGMQYATASVCLNLQHVEEIIGDRTTGNTWLCMTGRCMMAAW